MRGSFKEKKTFPMTSRTIPSSSTFDMSCVSIPQTMPEYTNCYVGNLNISLTKSTTFRPMKSITTHACSQGIPNIFQ